MRTLQLFPQQPEQCTAGLLVSVRPDGSVRAVSYGADEPVIRFPFTIPGS